MQCFIDLLKEILLFAYAAGPKVRVGHSTLPLEPMRIQYLSQGSFIKMLPNTGAYIWFLWVKDFLSGHGGTPSSILSVDACGVLAVLSGIDLQSHTVAVTKQDLLCSSGKLTNFLLEYKCSRLAL